MDNTIQTALNKLTERQRHYCRNLSVIIDKCRGSKESLLTYFSAYGKLKGYLDCLRDFYGLTRIEDSDIEMLFAYYTMADRSIE